MTIASTSIPDTTGAAPREVVFVDSRVQDVATLLKGFAPGVEVVYLQAGADGLAQMAPISAATESGFSFWSIGSCIGRPPSHQKRQRARCAQGFQG